MKSSHSTPSTTSITNRGITGTQGYATLKTGRVRGYVSGGSGGRGHVNTTISTFFTYSLKERS